MDFKSALIERYHSTHYVHLVPEDDKTWNWVIRRIHTNFGAVFGNLPKGSQILDVGCGVGYLEDYLLKHGFENIDSVDLSPEQIEVAKQKLASHGLDYESKVRFASTSAFDFLEEARGYDLVAMLDFIEHFTKDQALQLLNLSYEALKAGGQLLLRTINADNPLFGRHFYHDFTHETPFTPDSIRQCLAASNFNLESVDYEEMGSAGGSVIRCLKGKARSAGLRVLAKLLGIRPKAFSINLVVVARK
jgi:2-polyprenyl-3-methyl-5-hydroxy-6-metoxy-1,4-benzoquinol methylase